MSRVTEEEYLEFRNKYQPFPEGRRIPISELIKGRVYKIRARQLKFGVFDGVAGFIGIREKIGKRFLFAEVHWDTGAPYGTVDKMQDLGIDLPEDITLTRDPAVYQHDRAFFEFLEKIESGEITSPD